jgi:putative tricarboxylic transport membrane protein
LLRQTRKSGRFCEELLHWRSQLLCSIGTFALQASVFDLGVMLDFGFIGILFRAANYPLSPIVIGLILGPILEANLRRSLLISREGYWIFLDRPVSATLVAVNCMLIVGAFVYALRKLQRRSMNEIGKTPN